MAIPGETVTFANKEADTGPMGAYANNNWSNSIHDYSAWSYCSVTKSGSTYTATINYNLRDYYDWDKNSVFLLKELHFINFGSSITLA